MLPNLLLSVLNKILLMNQASKQRLQSHVGNSFAIKFNGLSIIKAKIDIDGLLISVKNDNVFDVVIDIPIKSATYLINHDKLEIFRMIKFSGDKELVRSILEIITTLHFSGVYEGRSLETGFIMAQIESMIKIVNEQLQLMLKNSINSVSEYLMYETEDIVTSYELEEFCDEIDDLRNQLDRLESRVNQLIGIM